MSNNILKLKGKTAIFIDYAKLLYKQNKTPKKGGLEELCLYISKPKMAVKRSLHLYNQSRKRGGN